MTIDSPLRRIGNRPQNHVRVPDREPDRFTVLFDDGTKAVFATDLEARRAIRAAGNGTVRKEYTR